MLGHREEQGLKREVTYPLWVPFAIPVASLGLHWQTGCCLDIGEQELKGMAWELLETDRCISKMALHGGE